MEFGIDEMGRYCERGGTRHAVERWPLSQVVRGRFPACCWLGVWWLSKITGWRWCKEPRQQADELA